jgi:hypothetical protein
MWAQNQTKEETYTEEFYYKVKWGYADEFMALFKKNHYPLLKRQLEMGRIVQLKAEAPVFHSTEEGRWDYRITIVWKSRAVKEDGFDEAALAKQLYPDHATFKKEEQRRFEILLAHWDVPLKKVVME